MNNFIYENKTKVYFGTGCVKEFLISQLKDFDTVMIAYGQGSAKKNGIYDEVLTLLKRAEKMWWSLRKLCQIPHMIK